MRSCWVDYVWVGTERCRTEWLVSAVPQWCSGDNLVYWHVEDAGRQLGPLRLVFGRFSHICYFIFGGFIVFEKYRIKEGTTNYWPWTPKSRGRTLPRQPHPQLWFTETTLAGVQPPFPPGPPPFLDSVEDQIPAQSVQQAGTTWRPLGDLVPLPLIIMFDRCSSGHQDKAEVASHPEPTIVCQTKAPPVVTIPIPTMLSGSCSRCMQPRHCDHLCLSLL